MAKGKSHETEDKLLQAALELFSEKGYLGATTKEIAKRAGVSELTLFRHFKSKENLFTAVLNRYSFLPKLRELLKEIEGKPLEKALLEIAQAFLLRLRSRKPLIKIMHTELSRYPKEVGDAFKRTIIMIHQELAQYFKTCQEKNLLKDIHPMLLAHNFLGVFFSYFLIKDLKEINTDNYIPEEEIIKRYVEIFLKGASKD